MSQAPQPQPSERHETIMIPRPGGRRSAAPAPAMAFPESGMQAGVGESLPTVGINPLVAQASPLLDVIPALRRTLDHPEPATLREQLLGTIAEFEAGARHARIEPEHVLAARYALCTVIDEAVGQTPWAERWGWGRQSLLVTLHRESWGGEKFFLLLDKALEEPRRNLPLLELMYVCLALGFEGRFRVLDNGRSQLEALRGRLYSTIRRERGEFERDLSGHWRGLQKRPRPFARRVPVWTVLASVSLLLFGTYLAFALLLAQASDPVFAALGALRVEPGEVVRAQAMPSPPIVATETVPAAPRLKPLLTAEIAQGQLDVIEEGLASHVVLRGDRFYEPGRAEIRADAQPVIARVAEAMNRVPGRVTVVGHTDDRPIRSPRFPSNYELSLQRAQGVAALLAERLQDRGRIRAEGRADSRPVASNDTPEGRSRNRRVEITLRAAP